MTIERAARLLACWACALVLAEGARADAFPSPFDSCEYVNVFAVRSSTEPATRQGEAAEAIRRRYLEAAVGVLPSFGLRVVPDREEAYWLLSASSLVGPGGSLGVFLELTAGIELQRHLYVAELDDPEFPYRGEIGGNYYFEIHPERDPQQIWREVFTGVSRLWALEFEQVSALCAISAQLKEEGWQGLKELRVELAEEIKRVRRERAAGQQRVLELEVEDPTVPAPQP